MQSRCAPAVLADGVEVRYRDGALGIIDVSLQIAPGQVVALLGPNGAGKTTTVRALSGFLKAERATVSGRIEVFGTSVIGREPHVASALGVGVVPERVKVFASMTVAENLTAVGRLPSRGTARREAFGRVFDLFPVLAERRSQLAGRLSGGQQQMLAIARALLTEPKVLLVDEMTLGLHHSLHEPLFEAVRAIAANDVAVLLVDENASFALEAADVCYLVSSGRITMSGPATRFRDEALLAAGYTQ